VVYQHGQRDQAKPFLPKITTLIQLLLIAISSGDHFLNGTGRLLPRTRIKEILGLQYFKNTLL
jgi:hypothetical protein